MRHFRRKNPHHNFVFAKTTGIIGCVPRVLREKNGLEERVMGGSDSSSEIGGKTYRRFVMFGITINFIALMCGITYGIGSVNTQLTYDSQAIVRQEQHLSQLAASEAKMRRDISSIAQWIKDHSNSQYFPNTK